MNDVDMIRRNLELKRMTKDIRRMREQIATLKEKLLERMIERDNVVCGEMYNMGE